MHTCVHIHASVTSWIKGDRPSVRLSVSTLASRRSATLIRGIQNKHNILVMVDAPADAEDIAVPEYEEDFDEAYIGPGINMEEFYDDEYEEESTALLEGAPTQSNCKGRE